MQASQKLHASPGSPEVMNFQWRHGQDLYDMFEVREKTEETSGILGCPWSMVLTRWIIATI